MNDILNYWNDSNVESMYDKHLLKLEIDLIKQWIKPSYCVLDVGCGEGEGTMEYSKTAKEIDAIDFSDTRLYKAKERLKDLNNVNLKRIDICNENELKTLGMYDAIVFQRCLINLKSWEEQKKVLSRLFEHLKVGGRFLILEGSQQGVVELNEVRARFGLSEIPIRWHNKFIDDTELVKFFYNEFKMQVVCRTGFGSYFYLTRCIAPSLNKNHIWDSEFNERAVAEDIGLYDEYSRLKFWYFRKNAI